MKATMIAALVLSAAAGALAEVGQIDIGPEVALTGTRMSATPAAAFGGGVYLVAWREGYSGRGGGSDIYALRLRPGTLEKLDAAPIKVCTAPGNQDSVAVAFAGGQFVLAWSDMRGGQVYDVYAARISPAGRALDPDGLPVATGGQTQAAPAVASDGKGCYVAWMEYRGDPQDRFAGFYHVLGRRLSLDLKPLDEAPMDFGRDCKDPAVAFNGTHYLVAWSRAKALSATRVDPASGRAVAPPSDITKRPFDLPRLTSDGRDFVLTASARPKPNYWGWGGPGVVVAGRVLADGSAPEKDISPGYYMGDAAAGKLPHYIEASGWRRGEGKAAGNWPAGEPNGFKGTPYMTWPYRFSAVAPVADGYLVAWSIVHIRQQVFVYNPDIKVTYVEPGNTWRRVGEEPPPEGGSARKYGLPAAAAADRGENMPALVAGPGGEVLLVYDMDDYGKSLRIAARKILVH